MNVEQTELVIAWINDNIGYNVDRDEFKENYPKLYNALMRLLWELEH